MRHAKELQRRLALLLKQSKHKSVRPRFVSALGARRRQSRVLQQVSVIVVALPGRRRRTGCVLLVAAAAGRLGDHRQSSEPQERTASNAQSAVTDRSSCQPTLHTLIVSNAVLRGADCT